MTTRNMIKKTMRILAAVILSTAVIGCSGDIFEQYKEERSALANPPLPDIYPPSIVSVRAADKDKLEVVFSEEVEETSAENKANYYAQGNNRLTVDTAVLEADNKTVTLTLDLSDSRFVMNHGREYTLVVLKVADLKGNPILNAFSTFIGRGSVVAQIYRNAALMPGESPYPALLTNSPEFTIKVEGFTGTGSYAYSIDNGSFSAELPVSTTLVLNSLSEGYHSLKVVAKNPDNNEWQDFNNATITGFTIDTVAPTAVIVNAPPNVTDSREVSIFVTGSDSVTYRYSLNGSAWSDDLPLSRMITRTELPDAVYTLLVKAKDSAGNEQVNATQCVWTVSTERPVAVLANLPDKNTRYKSANISVAGSNVNYYRYQFNGGAWSDSIDIQEPIALSSLADGIYSIAVIGSIRANDPSSEGDPVIYTWTVDTVEPVAELSGLPSLLTNSQTTYISVGSASGDVVRYRYRLVIDGVAGELSGLYTSGTPLELKALPERTYTLKVMGIDAAGNMQSEISSTQWTWTVDLSPPRATLDVVQPGGVVTTSTNLIVNINGPGSSAYKYKLDGGTWSNEVDISVQFIRTTMSDGYHTLAVITRDAAGNWQSLQDPTEFIWEIDTVPPVAVLSDKPAIVNDIANPGFTVGGSGVSLYKYRLKQGAAGTWTDWTQEFDRINEPRIQIPSAFLAAPFNANLTDEQYSIEVAGIDRAGNIQIVPTLFTWTMDSSNPTATFRPDTLPLEMSKENAALIVVESVDSYKYKLDSGAWSASWIDVSTLINLTGLSEGPHTLSLLGKTGSSEQTNPTTYSWSVDVTAPVAAISNTPPARTSSQTADITVSGIGVYAYKWSIDNPDPSSSTEVLLASDNIINLTNLPAGDHTVYVIGRDQAGNWQPVAQKTLYTWTVDTSVPAVQFVGASLPSEQTNLTTLSVSLTGAVAYKYKLDSGLWSGEISIGTPISRVGLAAGQHTLLAVGKNLTDTWQDTLTPTSYTWTVDTTAPAASDIILTGLPDNPTMNTAILITVSGPITHYKFKLNMEAWSGEISTAAAISRSGISNGNHTLYVVARDTAGNWLPDAQAKTYTWTVNTSAPLATLTNRPDDPTTSTSASFNVGGSEIVRYKYRLDGVDPWSAWTAVATPISLNSLSETIHTIEVCGTKDATGTPPDSNDAVTQTDATATTYIWTVDVTPPTVSFAPLPADPTTTRDINVLVSGAGVFAYKYRLDSANPADWSSELVVDFPLKLLNLSVQSHTLEVLGRDAAGNWSTVPFSHTWTIEYPALASPLTYDAGSTSTSADLVFSWIKPGGTADVKIRVASNSDCSGVISESIVGNLPSTQYHATSQTIQTYYACVSVNSASGLPIGDTSWKPWGAASNGITLVGSIGGRVKNVVGLTPVQGITVEVKRMDNSLKVAEAVTDENGDFSAGGVPIGTTFYKLEIAPGGGYLGAGKNSVTVQVGEETNVGQLFLVPTTASAGTISGTTTDANTGFSLGATTIQVYDWQGVKQGSDYTAQTNGSFLTASLSPGVYTVLMSKSGYFPLSVDNMVVNGNKSIGRQSLCEVLVEPQVRFVYQWDSFPSDPDIFITGPTATTQAGAPTNRFVVQSGIKMFNEATGASWGGVTANGDWYGTQSTTSLVQDGVTGFGPEAINLYRFGGAQYARGMYTFTVHRFAYNPRELSGNTAVFTLVPTLSSGSFVITGTVPTDRNITRSVTRTNGSTNLIPATGGADELYYRPNFLVTGTGIPAGSFVMWYDRSVTPSPFQINQNATSSGSANVTITNRIEAYGIYPGMPVTGTGIQSGTVVQNVVNTGGGGYSITLSKTATANGAQTLSFYPGWGTTSGTVRVYDSQGMAREVIFQANMLGSDLNCWKAVKLDVQGNTRDKRRVIQINQFMQDNTRSKATMDW